jgi:hypothetical protein
MQLEDALAYALVVGIVLMIIISSVSNYRRHRAERQHAAAAAYDATPIEE